MIFQIGSALLDACVLSVLEQGRYVWIHPDAEG